MSNDRHNNPNISYRYAHAIISERTNAKGRRLVPVVLLETNDLDELEAEHTRLKDERAEWPAHMLRRSSIRVIRNRRTRDVPAAA